MSIHIIDASPVYVIGLVHVLTGAGLTVSGINAPPAPLPTHSTGAFLVDPSVLEPPAAARYVADVAKVGPVLVLEMGIPEEQRSIYLGAGAYEVLDKIREPKTLVETVQAMVAQEAAQSTHKSAPALSNRESQVLQHISRGLTHGQVARRLGISQHTVDTYVKRARLKLSLGNKAELTRAALFQDFDN
ncbi:MULTISPECIES: response regulator transcription factor [unclassified Nonomuraea]|uniref:response regulator transcription factor n=1 Tax=unclassified Nonomuraea TaxID=2593643 RepID=UPI001376D432|nr:MULTISPECIES: helix-turn-helix transcriptional regulator [unclassified Nonomuraea]NBF00584.1 DNA-binding response regulator [Nonomuraea sp. K271]